MFLKIILTLMEFFLEIAAHFNLDLHVSQHKLRPGQYTPPKKLVEFSRHLQEQKLAASHQVELQQLTEEEMDFEVGLTFMEESCRLFTVSDWLSGYCAMGQILSLQPGHIKDHNKKWYQLPPCLASGHKGRSLVVLYDCRKGRIVCRTVYGDVHLKDLLGSIARVGYCIPMPDFYLVLHGL